MLARSLAAKVLLVFLGVVTTAEVLVFGLLSWNQYRDLHAELEQQVVVLLELQRTSMAPALWEYDTSEIATISRQVSKLAWIEGIAVFDDGGGALFQTGEIDKSRDIRQQDIVYTENGNNERVGFLRIGIRSDHILERLYDEMRLNALLVLILILCLSGATLYSLRRFVGLPLSRMKAAIEHFQLNKTYQMVDWQSRDELGVVIDAFNEMQDRQVEADRQILTYQSGLEDLVEQRTAEITASIEYASRIQRATLPVSDEIDRLLPQHFVIWEPRDVVGGDMYWVYPWQGGCVVAVGDCTGHGVPGALISLLASGALTQVLRNPNVTDPVDVMGKWHRALKRALNQDRDHNLADDGMEVALCYIPPGKDALHFVGAKMDLYLTEDGECQRIRGARCGIGYPEVPSDHIWPVQHIAIKPGQTWHLTTDGLVDQIGGERNVMFGRRRFQRLLTAHADRPLGDHKNAVQSALLAWQGDQFRRDDVTVMGFSL